MTDFARRRAVFANLLACYHNSFAGAASGVIEHSPGFIARVVEASNADPQLAAATLRLDPRLTATDQGAVAFSIAKAVSEDKQLAPNFIDLEMCEDALMVYFESKTEIAKAQKVLSEVARVGIVAKPGDRISDSVTSDIFILAVQTNPQVSEAVVAEMKKKMPAFLRKKKGDKAKDDKADDKCDGDGDGDKGNDKSSDEDDGAKESYRPGAECAHYGLEEGVFGDESLARLETSPEAVKAVYKGLFGERALRAALAATIDESGAPEADDENGQRNRLLRILAGRGYLAGAAPAPAWDAPVVEGLNKVTAGLVASAEKWPAFENSPHRVAASNEDYAAAVDEVAVAIDTNLAEAGDVFKAFVDRVADQGLEAVTEEKRAALLAKIKEAAAKNEAAVIARCLTALANVHLFERGMFTNAAALGLVTEWSAFIAEATKPAPVAASPIDANVDELLGLGA